MSASKEPIVKINQLQNKHKGIKHGKENKSNET
jgi:hypothetical protein